MIANIIAAQVADIDDQNRRMTGLVISFGIAVISGIAIVFFII